MRDVKRASADAEVDELPESRRWTGDIRAPSGGASLEIRLPAPIFPVTSVKRTSAPVCPVTQPGGRTAGSAGMRLGVGGQPLRMAGPGDPGVVGGAPPQILTSLLRSRRLAKPESSFVAAPTRQDLARSNDGANGGGGVLGGPDGGTGANKGVGNVDVNTAGNTAGTSTTGVGADNHQQVHRSRRRPTFTPAPTAATASGTAAAATRPKDVGFCNVENGSSAAVAANAQKAAAATPRGSAATATAVSSVATGAASDQDVQPALRKRERRGRAVQPVAETAAAVPTAAPASVEEIGPKGSLTGRVVKRRRSEVLTAPFQSPPQPQSQHRQPLATWPSRVAAIAGPANVQAGPAQQLPKVPQEEQPRPQAPTVRLRRSKSELMPSEGCPRRLTRLHMAIAPDVPVPQQLKVSEPHILPRTVEPKARPLEGTVEQHLLPSAAPFRASPPPPTILDAQPSMPKERAPAARQQMADMVVTLKASAAALPVSPVTLTLPPPLLVPVMGRPPTAPAATVASAASTTPAPPVAAAPLQVPVMAAPDHLPATVTARKRPTAFPGLSTARKIKEPAVAAAPLGLRPPVRSPPEVPMVAEEQPIALALKNMEVVETDASAAPPSDRYTVTQCHLNGRCSHQKALAITATAQQEPLLEQELLLTPEASVIPQCNFEPIRIVLWLYAKPLAAPPTPLGLLPPRPAPAPREQGQPTSGDINEDEGVEEEDVVVLGESGGGGKGEEYDDADGCKRSGADYSRGGGGSSLPREAKRRQQLRQKKRLQAHLEKLEKFRRKRRRRERRALRRLLLQPAPGELAALPPPSDVLNNLLPQPMPCFLPEPASEAGQRLAEAAKASIAAATAVAAAESVAATATDGTLTRAAATCVHLMQLQPNSTPCLVCNRISRPVGCVRQDGRCVCRTCFSSTMVWRIGVDTGSAGRDGVGNASQAVKAAAVAAGSPSAATQWGNVAGVAGSSGDRGWVPVSGSRPAVGAVQLDVEWTADVVEEAVRLAELMMMVAAHERGGGDRGSSRCGAGGGRGPQKGGKRRRR
ncbi:hypothetical protein Vretimale_1933 [Volvox reticuliferus]|uniref:Uncharacterized protein n=1 Tax=Volvox reticuliferus TaxID=1737510 RepID=A0A8J4D0Z5_9CHLO|nr:hypothetical protein Vretifemale_17247 [Volvox reticuliferus]GIL96027.1 hypothetical protein Vretimale_1933 [Volvox reticuliferus]